jgi:hypothetical protein
MRNYKHFAIITNYLSIMFTRILFLVVFIFVSCLIALFLLYYVAHIYASCLDNWVSNKAADINCLFWPQLLLGGTPAKWGRLGLSLW